MHTSNSLPNLRSQTDKQPTSQNVVPLPPSSPGEWSICQIQEVLSRPVPAQLLSTRRQGGKEIPYLAWHTVARILDKYTPGWSWEVSRMGMTSDRLFLVGRLTVPTTEGHVWREATGTELLKRDESELAYGDPSSNAESMAFRRAAAKFGLGLYLYGSS